MHFAGKSGGSHLGRTVFFIRPGCKMAIRNPDGTLETATVHSLSVDVSGIPHVTYSVQVSRPHGLGTLREAGRILAVAEFMARYAGQSVAPKGVLARIRQRLRHAGYVSAEDGATIR